MFTIKVRGKIHLFNNKKEDDFLQFLPKYFKCQPEDMEVKHYDSSQFDQIDVLNLDRSEEEKASNVVYEHEIQNDDLNIVKTEQVEIPAVVSEEGVEISPKAVEIQKTIISTMTPQVLAEWPYVNGVFTKELKFKE